VHGRFHEHGSLYILHWKDTQRGVRRTGGNQIHMSSSVNHTSGIWCKILFNYAMCVHSSGIPLCQAIHVEI
jgi:hypothetical protein